MPPRRPHLVQVLTAVTGALLALVVVGAPAHSASPDPVVVSQDASTAKTTATATTTPTTTARTTARLTRTVDVAYTAGALTMQRLLDRCDGPVSVKFDGIRQRLLAEHDYCGGRWILGLETGDILRVSGGDIGGRYRVNDDIKVVRKGTSASVLRGMGHVVAQTCRPDGDTLRLVGLTRID